MVLPSCFDSWMCDANSVWLLVKKGLLWNSVLFSEEGNKGYGPVFEEQPIDTIYPEESSDGQVSMNCRARAVPPPTYR